MQSRRYTAGISIFRAYWSRSFRQRLVQRKKRLKPPLSVRNKANDIPGAAVTLNPVVIPVRPDRMFSLSAQQPRRRLHFTPLHFLDDLGQLGVGRRGHADEIAAVGDV